jgi:hypothetical protein
VSTATSVTYSGLSLTGAQAGNYSLTIQPPASASITESQTSSLSGILQTYFSTQSVPSPRPTSVAVSTQSNAAPTTPTASTQGATGGNSVSVQVNLGNGTVQTLQTSPLGESGFSFTVPQEAISRISTGREDSSKTTIEAVLSNGSPLPSWLNFNAPNNTFSASTVPENISSIGVKIQVKDGTSLVGENVISIVIPSRKIEIEGTDKKQ